MQNDKWKSTIFDLLKTVVLPLAVVFLTEPLYRQPLYDESLKLAPEMQKYDSWRPFMELASAIGTRSAYAFYMTMCFNSMAKPACLYFWCGIAFAFYVTN